MIKLLFIFSMFLMLSCGDKEKTNQEKILGTWIGNLCDDKNNVNKDTFIFTSADISYKGIFSPYTIQNYSINLNNILVNNIVTYNLNFNGENSLRLTVKHATGVDDVYCLNKK